MRWLWLGAVVGCLRVEVTQPSWSGASGDTAAATTDTSATEDTTSDVVVGPLAGTWAAVTAWCGDDPTPLDKVSFDFRPVPGGYAVWAGRDGCYVDMQITNTAAPDAPDEWVTWDGEARDGCSGGVRAPLGEVATFAGEDVTLIEFVDVAPIVLLPELEQCASWRRVQLYR